MQLANEAAPEQALAVVAELLKPNQRVFIGVIDVINNAVESAETVRDRILMASKHIPAAQLGTTDDCGFSPFGDDVVTARDIAFAKIKARVEGSALAAQAMGL